MPQVFSSHPFFHFFYLNKTPLSRNEFIGILHSFKSSKQLSSLDAGSLLEPELKKEQITFSALPSPSGSLVDS